MFYSETQQNGSYFPFDIYIILIRPKRLLWRIWLESYAECAKLQRRLLLL